ncbi:hypothetical protein AB3X91_13120 [Paraburkholderia sp. BR14263]|uniref:hypothetical protein n=1 Tax=unclassified Paraburkholderia TaxID=2615204 RepID=UPI0034CF4C7D
MKNPDDPMDSWCSAITVDGRTYTGAVAREIRISMRGSVDNIVRDACEDAVRNALNRANAAVAKGAAAANVLPFRSRA